MKDFEFTYAGPATIRLDKLLLDRLPEVWDGQPTRSQLKLLIESGSVSVNGEKESKAGARIRAEAVVRVILPVAESDDIEALDLPLQVLYEDKDLIVIDKPAGLSMHPGAGNKSRTLVNALVHHFGRSRPALFKNGVRPGIVHRLDRDTTGIVVVAKTATAHAALAEQFSARSVDREYFALVLSMPRGLRAINTEDEGDFAANIGRDPHARKRMAVVKQGGKSARTHWKVLERMNHACLMSVKLETGRTHQIRVHMTHLGAPLIGDKTYGNLSMLPSMLRIAAEKFGRQALHAYKLEFTHPRSGERKKYQSALPPDFEKLIAVFRNEGKR